MTDAAASAAAAAPARIALQLQRQGGQAVDGPRAVFGPQGGSIGRGADNLLVLPDPARVLSRLHARIHWAPARFSIEVCGAHGLLLNGRVLHQGQQAPLVPGDLLELGDCTLRVCDADDVPTSAAGGLRQSGPLDVADSADPLADPFADLSAAIEVSPVADPFADLFADLASGTAADPFMPTPLAGADQPDPVWFAITAPAQLPQAPAFTAALSVHVASWRATALQQLQRIGGPLAEPLMDLAPSGPAGWRTGAPVEVRLEVQGGSVEPAEHRFAWNGRLHLAAFRVRPQAPATAAVALVFHVLLAGVPVGWIPWQVDLAQPPGDAGQAVPPRQQASLAQQAPCSAFASYASSDAEAVGLCLSALTRWAPALQIFQDCLDLRPGEAFKPQLAQRIAEAEAFLLFWSRRAAASPWVRWELDTACRGKPPQALIPMPLEDPAVAPPPPELADRHWRDRFMLARQGLAHAAAQAAADDTAREPVQVAALQAALCEGLRLSAWPGGVLTPAQMRLLGALLHDAVDGTARLLGALAALLPPEARPPDPPDLPDPPDPPDTPNPPDPPDRPAC